MRIARHFRKRRQWQAHVHIESQRAQAVVVHEMGSRQAHERIVRRRAERGQGQTRGPVVHVVQVRGVTAREEGRGDLAEGVRRLALRVEAEAGIHGDTGAAGGRPARAAGAVAAERMPAVQAVCCAVQAVAAHQIAARVAHHALQREHILVPIETAGPCASWATWWQRRHVRRERRKLVGGRATLVGGAGGRSRAGSGGASLRFGLPEARQSLHRGPEVGDVRLDHLGRENVDHSNRGRVLHGRLQVSSARRDRCTARLTRIWTGILAHAQRGFRQQAATPVLLILGVRGHRAAGDREEGVSANNEQTARQGRVIAGLSSFSLRFLVLRYRGGSLSNILSTSGIQTGDSIFACSVPATCM